jgi:thiol-disulfide isomerase/thioredoxin
MLESDGFGATFLTTTGDYRYLGGMLDDDILRLSVFDGAHAFLFVARWDKEAGTLDGDFWSRDTWHETWTATRNDDATLPDAFGLTTWRDGADLSALRYPGLDGEMRSLGDPAFAGKARIIEVFGTWCPNCNDATMYLKDLHESYAARGLSIVSLAFELTNDLARDTAQVQRYVDHHRIAWPVLVAGSSNKEKATEQFPVLDRIRSFPTFIFMDATGDVKAIYQGFNGPATGDEYEKLRTDFERIIEGMLGE